MERQQISYVSKEEEENDEALAHRYHMDIFQKGKLEVADEILSTDFLLRNPVLPVEVRHGTAGTKQFASATIVAIPNRKSEDEDTVAKGDKVLIRWTLSGTNIGALFGNPFTGKPLVVTGFDLLPSVSRADYQTSIT
jgi:predicted ester cyclase